MGDVTRFRFEELDSEPIYTEGQVVMLHAPRTLGAERDNGCWGRVISWSTHYERGDGWDAQGWVADLVVELVNPELDDDAAAALAAYVPKKGLWER